MRVVHTTKALNGRLLATSNVCCLTACLLVFGWSVGSLQSDAADSVIVINELQYQPADEQNQSEWIELHNLMGVTVDLSGWQLEGAGKLTFAEGTRIGGRDFLLLATNPQDQIFKGQRVYPEALTGRLANEGETIRLLNRSGRVMDRVRYRQTDDWPAGARGSGATLTKRNEHSAESGPANWIASSQLGGTPGTWRKPPDPEKPITTNLVSIGAEWHYHNTGEPAPTNWASPQFDASNWPTGKSPFLAGQVDVPLPPSRLFAYWRLDGEGAETVTDLVSGQPGRLVNGVQWIHDAERGSVLEFDGDDGYVDTTIVIPQMTLENDFTWAFWGFSRKAANVNVIVGNRHRADGADFSPREFIKFTNGGLEFHRLGSGEDILYPPIPRNEWVHHALVKQGRALVYYRNGVELSKQTLSAGLNHAQPLYFGGDQTRENWRGRLDEVGLWEVALSPSSISGLADGTFSPDTAPPPSDQAPLQAGTELPGISATTYFVTTFSFEGNRQSTELELNLRANDGAVIYLNGSEVHRFNLVNGDLEFNTLSNAPLARTDQSESVRLPGDELLLGRNVLSVAVHQATSRLASEDLEFEISLVAQEFPNRSSSHTSLQFTEISAGGQDPFLVEISNRGATPVDLSTYEIRSSTGLIHEFRQTEPLSPKKFLALSIFGQDRQLERGARLFLVDHRNQLLIDAIEVGESVQARQLDRENSWHTPQAPTFGEMNPAPIVPPIVINEIMYHPMKSDAQSHAAGQWIELLNRGTEPVNLSDWRFDDGVQFTFPPNTTLAPNQFLVLVGDKVGFEQSYPLISFFGEWTGTLSRRGERLRLVDALGNRVDEVSYFDSGRWPSRPDGGGSSLELTDPHAHNQSPESWSASANEGRWQTVSYRGRGISPSGDPTRYQEFILGLLAAGECLIDDISVVEDPDGVARELIQNGTFEQGNTRFWRALGNHHTAEVIDDPDQSGNSVLRLIATGPTEHMSNHLETTLRSGDTYVRVTDRREYQISYRAKWIGGSNQLHSRLYFNRLARTSLLTTDRAGGSPGTANTRHQSNIGPSFDELSHAPAIPKPNESISIRVSAQDPDGVEQVNLHYSIRNRRFTKVSMSRERGSWVSSIPGQEFGSTIQFYVEAQDGFGATAYYPAGGPAAGAYIPVEDGQADLDLADCHPMNLRIVMKDADIDRLHAPENVMSNHRLPCTVIVDEREIYYDASVRLKGSEHGRASDLRVSYNLRFSPSQLFLGAHETIAVDRSGAGEQYSQREILIKHAINHAGGIPGSQDDLIRVIAPRPQHTGSAILSKSRFDREFLNHQFENGNEGTLYEYELVYVLSGTTGGVEGFKVTQPSEVHGVPVRSLGTNNKERYRWHWQLKNNRDLDDFTPILNMVSALGQSGSNYRQLTSQRLDIDQWLRAFAIQVLFGIADNYASGSQHNAMFYQRPSDGRMLYFPWDMDFTFVRSPSSDLTPNTDLRRLIAASETNRRNYYRHLWEITQTTFNPAYLSEWSRHYSCFLPYEDLTRFDSYIRQRHQFALTEIQKQFPPENFRISTNTQSQVAENSLSLEGHGWLDLAEIQLGDGRKLPLEWTAWNRWRVALPIKPGVNRIELSALNHRGEQIGSDSIEIIGVGTVLPASIENLGISELMYHPAPPDEFERAAGWTSPEDFEFIELVNLSNEFSIDLAGATFTDGIRYALPSNLIRPGARAVIAGNLKAFQARYGREIPIIGEFHNGLSNRLSNSGERLKLEDASSETILSVEWSDSAPWPNAADGMGFSLVLRSPGLNSPETPSSWRTSSAIGGNPNTTDRLSIRDWMEALNVTDLTTDSDEDGWNAAWEYLAGTDPREMTSQPRTLLTIDDEAETLALELLTETGADDVEISPQLSFDLETWTEDIAFVGRQKHPDGREWIRFVSRIPLTEAEAQYIRINLSSPLAGLDNKQ